jgi:hypothetical protein
MDKGNGKNFDAGVLVAQAALYKSAVAIRSAHHVSIAPKQKNGSGEQSSIHTASYVNTSAAELIASYCA